ncbi:hypothetical protein MMC30_001361 [Trapelia coarctata]|nr:hypothetical protein [Trapelia coarctata]
MLTAAVFSVIVTAFSIFATVRAKNLYLPTNNFTHTLAIGLPLANCFAIYISSRRPSQKPFLPRLHAILPRALPLTLTVLFMLDTVLVTLASSSLSPEALNCAIESRWWSFFETKNGDAVRRIQDAFDCCGLLSTVDQAWPFPRKGVPATACQDRTGRTRACEAGWEGAERVVLTGLIVVGVAIMMAKIVFLVVMRTRPEWFGAEGGWAEEQLVRGRILGEEEESLGRGRYLDVPEEAAGETVEGDREGQGRVMTSG